ncbi:sH3 domain protein [Clostridium sp. CAG:575]|nr:sH3 domain protein [Clostridium sp. CAG:575]
MRVKVNFKKRLLYLILALVTVLTTIPPVTTKASSYSDGMGYTMTNRHTVYASASTSTYKGTIYAKETFTILESTGEFYHVEYSTSSGTKEGYVKIDSDIISYSGSTYVANVLSTSTVYFGPDSNSYETVGNIFAGEHVVVLSVGNSWNMIEYNTSSGRKRGYVPQSCLSWGNYRFKSMSSLPQFRTSYNYVKVSASTPVRSGPTIQTPIIGYVSSSDNPIVFAEKSGVFYYIRYKVDSSGKYKTGYIAL